MFSLGKTRMDLRDPQKSPSPGRGEVFPGCFFKLRGLGDPARGFYLGDQEDGQLVLGGVDEKHFEGKFHFLPVAPRMVQGTT